MVGFIEELIVQIVDVAQRVIFVILLRLVGLIRTRCHQSGTYILMDNIIVLFFLSKRLPSCCLLLELGIFVSNVLQIVEKKVVGSWLVFVCCVQFYLLQELYKLCVLSKRRD